MGANRFSISNMAFAALLVSMLSFASFVECASADTGIKRLGYRWDVVVPGGWTGIWTRRDIAGAISNQYDAVWSHPTYGLIRSDIRIHIDVRDGLIIERRDLTGGQVGKTCRYVGQLYFAQRTASGTFGCQWAPGPFTWSARTWR